MTTLLTGRRAIVTGASGGIGGAVARELARAGADVVLTYSGYREGADAAARDISAMGRSATVVQTDLRVVNAGRALIEQAAADGPVDILDR